MWPFKSKPKQLSPDEALVNFLSIRADTNPEEFELTPAGHWTYKPTGLHITRGFLYVSVASPERVVENDLYHEVEKIFKKLQQEQTKAAKALAKCMDWVSEKENNNE